MSLRLPVSLTQVLRHTITPPKQALPSRFFSSQPVYRSQCLSPVARRPIPLSLQVPRSPSKPTTSFSFLRSFSTTRQNMMRPNYFPRSGRSGSGGPTPKAGFFRRLLIRLESYPHTYIIYGLLGLNIAIYFLWEYAKTSYQRFRDPSLYKFMTRNFLINEANIQAGRIWTFVTSCFSHSSGTHIFVNCLGLYFMAPAAAQLLGNVRFLGFYLVGGIASTMASLFWRRLRGDHTTSSEGASGAIYSCMAFFAAMFPQTQFLLFFVVPMPAWLFAGGIFAYDLFGALYRPNSTTDSAGHLGGIVAGLGAAMLFRKGRFPRGPRLR